jgi:hypothetical protein
LAEHTGNNGHGNRPVGSLGPFPPPADAPLLTTDPDTAAGDPPISEPTGPTIPLLPLTGQAPSPEPSAPGQVPSPAQPVSADLRTDGDIAATLASAAQNLAELSKEFPRSTAPARGPSRWLRKLIGIDETLLARVWEERPRYTGLGAIVLGTAMMAAFSMFDALNEAIGPVWPVLVVVALFWGTFICCIDRWLISSTHGTRSARWRIFIPRLALSLLFGVIIAMPLVLTIFGPEVVTKAATDQQNQLTTYESRLKACNPLPDQTTGKLPPSPANCGNDALPTPDPAVGLTQTLAREKQQRADLARQIASAHATIAQYDKTIRDECNGASGLGLSGIPGVGPNCNRDRGQEDSFKKQNDVGKWQQQLNALDEAIQTQSTTIGNQLQDYSNGITQVINAKIAARTHSQGRIGLLDRIDALGELFASNVAIGAATVLVGLFILAVDCLPVLSKMMSGTTNYDRLVEGRLRSAEAIAATAIRVRERHSTGADEVALHAVEIQVRAQLEQIDQASRVERGRRDAEVDRKIAELTDELRRMGS